MNCEEIPAQLKFMVPLSIYPPFLFASSGPEINHTHSVPAVLKSVGNLFILFYC